LSVTENERIQLRREVGQLMSDDTADILMRQLPPTGWGEITTNANLDHAVSRLRTELKHDITTHTQILRIEFQEHLGDLRTEMATEFGRVRTEMATEFDKTHVNIAELSTRFERALHEQTKSLFRMVFAANAVFVGLIVAASQLR
jgi:hypothetical protein